MDVKTSSGGWETMRSSVGNVVGKGAWGKGVIDDLKDITKNLEKAEEKISAKDEDGVVSFHHLDRTTTYQEIYEKMEVLYGFTNKAHDLVDETIDEKFYQEIDKYAVAMRDLTINKYSTKNITGATKQELVFTSSSMQEMQTVSKDKITVDDLFSDSSPLGKKMKADFDQYRLSQGDKEIKYEDFKQSMLNTGAFEYTSIKDKQMKKEMWVNLGIAAVIVIASIAFPPAGMALGLVVSSLEVGSAITGKDWVSGRELGTGERVFRGVLGGVGLGTELYALNSFSKNVRLASQIKYGGEGATSVQHLGDMVANSGKSSYGRVTEFGNSVKLNSTDIRGVQPVSSKYGTKIDSKVIEVEKANLPDWIQATFTDGQYRTVETLEDVKVYRTYGGKAKQTGGYATTSPAKTRIDAKIDTALLPEWGNSRKYEIEITIPKGQQLNIGKVAPQTIESTGTILSGGVDQILLPQGWSSEWITNTKIVPSK
ncbi:hypothetical protein [Carnobacterium maltaromaticum]|uniref:Uncharacterized domain protein n=1 Tax=Carnobacterium maltaromaticum LMA28 TaxID=1234679 RepID=K8E3G4_CARML|nr:hypothetical protein [Carnobacterium maltaromaticum]AOA01655.1 hypothetical protein BFC23_03745 [Carnobacterium maltaromaticum]MCI1817918.1 hypothetical protein [Carnobacterium maltaromaticum]CCO10729.1 putative uncharacterized domain protein [Carnobacterium maltaromaticum LMA28]